MIDFKELNKYEGSKEGEVGDILGFTSRDPKSILTKMEEMTPTEKAVTTLSFEVSHNAELITGLASLVSETGINLLDDDSKEEDVGGTVRAYIVQQVAHLGENDNGVPIVGVAVEVIKQMVHDGKETILMKYVDENFDVLKSIVQKEVDKTEDKEDE